MKQGLDIKASSLDQFRYMPPNAKALLFKDFLTTPKMTSASSFKSEVNIRPQKSSKMPFK